MLREPAVEPEVVSQALVPERKDPGQLTLHHAGAQQIARRAQRRLPLHLVSHEAAPSIRLAKDVGVQEGRERSADLLVFELPALFVPQMTYLTREVEGTLRDPNHDPIPVPNPALPLHHLHVGPGGS